MKCDKCGTEVEWKTIMGHYYWVAANGIHTHEDCLAVVRASGTALAAERDALAARVAALESKLAECERERDEIQALARENGVEIDRVQNFEAFTTEAKAAYPTKPRWLVRTGPDATAAKLAKAREAIGQMVFELERDEDDMVDVNEVADYVANLGRRALASLDPPEAAEKTEQGK